MTPASYEADGAGGTVISRSSTFRVAAAARSASDRRSVDWHDRAVALLEDCLLRRPTPPSSGRSLQPRCLAARIARSCHRDRVAKSRGLPSADTVAFVPAKGLSAFQLPLLSCLFSSHQSCEKRCS